MTQVRLGYGADSVVGPLDLHLPPSRYHVLIGPNGAGKSTLLRYLAGIIPHHTGHVTFDGRSLSALPRLERAKSIAYLSQDRTIAWPLRVRDVVMLGRIPYGSSFETATEADQQAVDQAIENTDLNALAEREITHLSGGERARVLLARVLATQAPWLLLDEPISGLDVRQQYLMLHLLRQQVDQGRSVLVVLHDLSLPAPR